MRKLDARWLLPLTLVAVLIGCAGQQARPAVDTAALQASVDSINKAFVAAVAARDTDAVVGLYSDDAHLLPPGMPRSDGHDAIRAAWAQFLRTPGLDLNITKSEPIFTEAGDMIIDLGSYSMKMTDAKGKPMEDVGKYVTIFKKTDSGWKIFIDTINSDKAPPGM